MARGFLLELPPGQETLGQCLLNGHRCLFGLEVASGIHERSCWRGDWHAIPPDGAEPLVIGVGVEDDTWWSAESSVPAWDEQVNLVGDVVAQLEQRECAFVGDNRFLLSDCHPAFADVVVLGPWEVSDAIETAPDTFETPLFDVMVQKLTADAVLSGLLAAEIAALLIGVGLKSADVRVMVVMHKSSIALLLRTYSGSSGRSGANGVTADSVFEMTFRSGIRRAGC